MTINKIEVRFTHNDREWMAVFANNHKGGVVENLGRTEPEHYETATQQWMTLMNANPQDVLDYLKEKGLDTSMFDVIVKSMGG